MIDDAEGDTMEWDPDPVDQRPARYVISFASGRVFDLTRITELRRKVQELVYV
jgi:hypothetical protein